MFIQIQLYINLYQIVVRESVAHFNGDAEFSAGHCLIQSSDGWLKFWDGQEGRENARISIDNDDHRQEPNGQQDTK